MSPILLDTHTFIWLLEGNTNLPITLRKTIDNTDEVFVSIVSFWEIAIKLNIGKISLQKNFNDLERSLNNTRLILLPISIGATVKLRDLPVCANHKDPFDRMLIAQAIDRNLLIASRDIKFDLYPIKRIW
jgi:PIN domain nuclease of toxin-antitoxin system